MARLRALVGLERRIEMLPLPLANRTRHIAIAGIWDALQGGGQIEQKCVPVPDRQRASRIEDSGELCVSEADRPHACPVTAFRSGIRSNASARNCDGADILHAHPPIWTDGTAPWVAHRYLAHGSRTLRNWRAASVTDFSIGKRSADEPPT
jgi:hypothetical protein